MSAQRFRIGTFNLYNLASAGRQFYNHRYGQDDYDRKIRWVGRQLRQMQANVVGFQEVFHAEALQEAVEASGIYRGATVIAGEASQNRPALGLVSQVPVTDFEFIRQFPREAQLDVDDSPIPLSEFSRPVLKARLQVADDIETVVLVTHLKSKNPKIPDGLDRHDPLERAIGKARSLIIRAAEATAIRAILLDLLKGNAQSVIVLGDINDAGRAVTSEIISGSPPWRRIPYAKKLRTWDSLLYNVKDIQARQSYRDVYYTHIHNGHYESLDHILVSQEFVRENPKHLGYVEYVSVLTDHLIDDTLSDERIPYWQSDHGQVVATIVLR